MRFALILLALLAGCTAPPALRDAQAPITSVATMDVDRFLGDWVITAGFAAGDIGHAGDRVTLSGVGGDAYLMRIGAQSIPLTRTAAGRFAQTGGQRFWVMWVDGDYRTALIGDPAGRHGWIMDRRAGGSADRMAAARSILEWNGYDLTQLTEVRQ